VNPRMRERILDGANGRRPLRSFSRQSDDAPHAVDVGSRPREEKSLIVEVEPPR
jgi:hypothetical protein